MWGAPLSSQSQSFSRSYGPNLPTSLNYCLLKTRGCEPRRPDADSVRHHQRLQTQNFQGCVKTIRTPRRTRRSSNHETHSPAKLIPGLPSVRKQRKRFSVSPHTSSSTVVLPLRRWHRTGILTGYPFEEEANCSQLLTLPTP